MNCPRCSSNLIEGELVCSRCGHMIPESQTRTANLKIDPKILRLKRVRRNSSSVIEGEGSITLRIRGMTEKIPLERIQKLILGRTDVDTSVHPDVDLSRYGASDRGVSRQHIELNYVDGELQVKDLGSANGTLLNGERLSPQQSYVLRDGDELLLGQLSIAISHTD